MISSLVETSNKFIPLKFIKPLKLEELTITLKNLNPVNHNNQISFSITKELDIQLLTQMEKMDHLLLNRLKIKHTLGEKSKTKMFQNTEVTTTDLLINLNQN